MCNLGRRKQEQHGEVEGDMLSPVECLGFGAPESRDPLGNSKQRVNLNKSFGRH